MIRVIIESPYAGDVDRNLRYLRAAMRDCLMRGEAPFASHALYAQDGVLDDGIPGERRLGITAGFAWRGVAGKTVVYTDLGVSRGMRYGIDDAITRGLTVEYRTIDGWAEVEQTTRAGRWRVFANQHILPRLRQIWADVPTSAEGEASICSRLATLMAEIERELRTGTSDGTD